MARKITLLPAGAYFAKRLDGVGGISDADLLSMAYAEIAADAPVSADRLKCGVLRARGGSATAFGAADSSALGKEGAQALMDADLAMPSFCALLVSGLEDGEYFFLHEGCVCAARLEGGAAADFAALDNAADTGMARAELADFLGFDAGRAVSVELESAAVSGKTAEFSARISGGGNAPRKISWSAPLSEFALCDVRGADFLRAARLGRFRRRIAACAIALIPASFAALAAFQIVVLVKSREIAETEAALAAMEPEAKAIEARAERVAAFSDLARPNPTPLELLSKINSARPDGVVAASFSRKGSSFEIAGTSNDLSKINGFVSKLRSLPGFADVKSKSDSSKSASKFSVTGTFKK